MENKNNEIISRREFFKGAAKKALPIIGAVALMNVPNVLNAATTRTSCDGTCSGSCSGYCTSCTGSCSGGCTGCSGSCSGSSTSSSY